SLTTLIGNHWRVPFIMAPLAALYILACLQVLPMGRAGDSLTLIPTAYQTLSLDPFETERFAIQLLAAALALAMLLRFTVSRRRLLHLTHLVIIVGAASAALAFWRQLLPHSEFASLWKHQQQHGGSFGQFINRNHFALLMEMSLGPTLSLALYVRPGTRRSIYFAITFLIWLALILTSSRGAIISMMGQLAFLSWISSAVVFGPAPFGHQLHTQNALRHRFWRVSRTLALRCSLILVLLGAVSVGVVWLGGEPVRQRIESVPEELQ